MGSKSNGHRLVSLSGGSERPVFMCPKRWPREWEADARTGLKAGGWARVQSKVGGSVPVCVEISKLRGAADTDTLLLVMRRSFHFLAGSRRPVEEHFGIKPASRMGRGGTSVNFPGGEKVGKSLADGFGPLLFDLLWKGGKVY